MDSIQIDNGFITVKNTGTGAHRTFQIRTQKADARFAPGERIVSLLTGRDNTSDYQSFGFVKADGWIILWKKKNTPVFQGLAKALRLAAKALASDQDTFETPKAVYTVELSKRCIRCNRQLTTPVSLERGYGPECAKHLGVA